MTNTSWFINESSVNVISWLNTDECPTFYPHIPRRRRRANFHHSSCTKADANYYRANYQAILVKHIGMVENYLQFEQCHIL